MGVSALKRIGRIKWKTGTNMPKQSCPSGSENAQARSQEIPSLLMMKMRDPQKLLPELRKRRKKRKRKRRKKTNKGISCYNSDNCHNLKKIYQINTNSRLLENCHPSYLHFP